MCWLLSQAFAQEMPACKTNFHFYIAGGEKITAALYVFRVFKRAQDIAVNEWRHFGAHTSELTAATQKAVTIGVWGRFRHLDDANTKVGDGWKPDLGWCGWLGVESNDAVAFSIH
jgi:hypothetical protein